MFTHATPSSSTLATTTPQSSAASPTRTSRLRGLSYLRNYTHSHLYTRDSPSASSPDTRSESPLTRATSNPSPPSASFDTVGFEPLAPVVTADNPSAHPATSVESPTIQISPDTAFARSGWPTTVTGQSVASSILQRDLAANREDPAMVRTRSGSAAIREAGSDISQMNGGSDPHLHGSPPPSGSLHGPESKPTIRFSQHQDARAPRPSLIFSPMGRTLPTGKEIIRVGRYSERETQPNQPANLSTAAPVGFKSKVVSRRHCEFWAQDGEWFIKDVKSSSGTFLNHVRLSSPGTESKPFPVKNGDIVQLGIDFKGGEEMIFRCVKIRIEVNRAWQTGINSFNVTSHQRLRNMAKQIQSTTGTSSQDCSICLGAVAPCQSLFVAPCSHTWHYKCVRRIINGPHWPHFVCPNCRAVADLDADVDEPTEGEWEELKESDMEASAVPQASSGEEQEPQPVPPPEISEPQILSQVPTTNVEPVSNGVQGGYSPEELMDNLDINDRGRESEPRSQQDGLSAPIDIARSKRSSSKRRSDDESADRRTPSPGHRSPDVLSGVDGPMTPRNDAGPFIFDGSGGRRVAVQTPTPNMGAVVESLTPSP
ncbi:hypothetical protein V497_04535 [Pseudogymnoascus sp. VKM F-4516 (FW-969)]|nr:hypothetical protein V497_04535 [Pseudogymnoascus sp. VKM F-4516 (FW-969)]